LTDPEADYERLVRPLEDRMIQSVWRILRNADDADDALQSALATLWKQWDRVRRHEKPEALILRVCIDAAYDYLRGRMRRQRLSLIHAKINSHTTIGPSLQMESEESEREIMQAIADLPGNQRTSTYLRLIEGHSYEAIALSLGCGEATVRKHVARGRQKLQETLSHLTRQ
jgi:RNA polymerase sigma factor (sigma-70 family)